MDNGALIPDMPVLNAEPIAEQEAAEVDKSIDEARVLAGLMQTPGWKKITSMMRDDIEKLRNMRGVDVAGKDFAEIGQKFLVASLTADHLQKYLDNVENAAKAVVEHERAKQPK